MLSHSGGQPTKPQLLSMTSSCHQNQYHLGDSYATKLGCQTKSPLLGQCIHLPAAVVLAANDAHLYPSPEDHSWLTVTAPARDNSEVWSQPPPGADNIRKYWSRYYQGSQGVIFVLDSASSEDDLETARNELHSALHHPQLCTLPFLILANHQDKPAARSVQEEYQTVTSMGEQLEKDMNSNLPFAFLLKSPHYFTHKTQLLLHTECKSPLLKFSSLKVMNSLVF
ncbi:hypothetical protein STEG23_003791 [Scotinomys teguina]